MHPAAPSDPPVRRVDTAVGPLAFTDEGDGPPTLLALPGLPGRLRDFRWLAPEVSPWARFLRMDPPGFGDSPREGFRGQDLATRAAAVLALMDALALPPLTLVGHSSGAMVAVHLARHHPDRVRALALVCAPGATAHYPERAMHLAAVALRSRVGRVLLGPAQRRGYAALGFPRGLSDAERSYTTLDAAQQDFAQHGADVEALTCPVLLAWAEDDPLIPLPLADELAARAPAGPRLRFPDGGHNLQKSKAVELAAALRTLDPAGG